MPEAALADHLVGERSRAVRLLLANPLLDAAADPDGFRLVARHQLWLAEWFETACGWSLALDAAAGFARLAKRSATPDASRPLRRSRGSNQPFDRRRYELLCHVCAEMVRHPVTTVGLLASALTAEAGFESERHGERAAFVDALRALVDWGALRASGGDVDAYVASERGNAILTADLTRLHRLLVSAAAPSSLDPSTRPDAATEALLAEPRYGAAALDPGTTGEEQRLRWVRHTLARKLLDDPAVHLDDLGEAERAYLANPAGRRWLRERSAEAGFELEERSEGFVAVDPDGLATDRSFPAPHGNAHQLALLLAERMVAGGAGDERRLQALTATELRLAVDDVLAANPGWARTAREGDGPRRLADEAVALLAGFDLVTVEPDGTVVPRPALARYRTVAPAGDPTLFEEVS